MMKQKVVVVASEEAMVALAPVLKQARGSVIEHVTNPGWAMGRIAESPPELLVLVHPLPEHDTVTFWQGLKERLPVAMPQTVIVAAPEDLFELDALQGGGPLLVNQSQAIDEIESALSNFLRKSPRPDARVMVKVAVELGAGRVLRIAQTVNVSRSGLLIRTQEMFPTGATLDLKMELPGDKDIVEARAVVVRTTDPELEDVRGIGARFVSFRGQDEARFDEFMRRAVIDSASGRRA